MKGCQKKVIFLKNTGSYLFDEAYFIISKEGESTPISEDSMICEANKIIESGSDRAEIRSPLYRRVLSFLVPFLIGAFVTALTFILI
jgi:hypothetical protein